MKYVNDLNDYRVGAVLFTVNLRALASFYERVTGLRVLRAEHDYITLASESFRLTVHQIPEQYAKNIVITVPPVVRERSAIKLSFRVDSISGARQAAAELGGLLYGIDQEWSDDSSTTCRGYDPDGNVFQVFQIVGRKT